MSSDALVLSASELRRLQAVATDSTGCSQSSLAEERERRHKLSEQRAKGWGNTIDAMRAQKADERKSRKEAAEQELKRLDLEEKRFQREKRAKALARAQKIFYESHDQVRTFKSKLMLTDVLAERAATEKFKTRKSAIIAKRDKAYYDHMCAEMKRYDDREAAKQQALHEKNMETRRILNEQMELYREKQHQRNVAQKAEAKRLEEMRKEDEERERMREVEKKERALQMTRDLVQMNEDMKVHKSKLQAIEDEKDAKIAQYAAQKEQNNKQRRQKEKERFDEMQRIKQAIIDKQTAYLEQLKAQEDAGEEAAVKQAEEDFVAKEAEKTRKREALRKDCEESCARSIARRTAEKEEAVRVEQEMLRSLKAKLDIQEQQEHKKEATRKKCAIQTERFIKKQMRSKRARELAERKDDRSYQLRTLAHEDEIEQRIREDAEKLIREYKAKGRDVTALLQELNKPDRLPNVW